MNQQAQALENAASGERVTHSIHFPATGDYELDLMNGLLSVLDQLGNRTPAYETDLPRVKRVLQWFFNRTHHLHGLPVMREVQVPYAAYPPQNVPYTTVPHYEMLPQTTWAGLGNPPTK